MICPNCNKEVSEASANCPFCNAPLYNNAYNQNTGNNIPHCSGNNFRNSAYAAFNNYMNTVKTIKIFSIVGILTSLGYIGVIFAILSIVSINKLPAPSAMQIPYEARYKYEQSVSTVKTAKTLNIISFIIFGLSSLFGIISGVLSYFI